MNEPVSILLCGEAVQQSMETIPPRRRFEVLHKGHRPDKPAGGDFAVLINTKFAAFFRCY